MNWVIPLQTSCAGIAAVLKLAVCLPRPQAWVNPVQQSRLRGKMSMLLLTTLPIPTLDLFTPSMGPLLATKRDCCWLLRYGCTSPTWRFLTSCRTLNCPRCGQALHRHRLGLVSKVVTKQSHLFFFFLGDELLHCKCEVSPWQTGWCTSAGGPCPSSHRHLGCWVLLTPVWVRGSPEFTQIHFSSCISFLP